MPNRIVRIILDTNLWISFLISNGYSKLDRILFSGDIELLFSEELLAEFIDVARRPKFRKYFSEEDIDEILQAIEEFVEIINVTTLVELCRDRKDNFLLSLAIDGNADYLITGDLDLLELKEIKSLKSLQFQIFYPETVKLQTLDSIVKFLKR